MHYYLFLILYLPAMTVSGLFESMPLAHLQLLRLTTAKQNRPEAFP
jgi:hypothetical protein